MRSPLGPCPPPAPSHGASYPERLGPPQPQHLVMGLLPRASGSAAAAALRAPGSRASRRQARRQSTAPRTPARGWSTSTWRRQGLLLGACSWPVNGRPVLRSAGRVQAR
eukprot:366503-Chlamydomonas_euryale.AAC.17